MNNKTRVSWAALFLAVALTYSFAHVPGSSGATFPYKGAGLSTKAAAAHLLDRFTFGARPGQVEEVERMGLERWFAHQLAASQPDEDLQKRLVPFESLTMTNAQIVQAYPRGGQVRRAAINDSLQRAGTLIHREQKGLPAPMQPGQTQAVLLRELAGQKILRAAYSLNQLSEVMTEFWFNHFNVSVSKGGVSQFVTSYERDVLRPNVFGRFEDLLLATAQSPAMLLYLDNNRSAAHPDSTQRASKGRSNPFQSTIAAKKGLPARPRKGAQGLNENYAREIMELHTLGVDGGYTQADVTAAARVFTGWGISPHLQYGGKGGSGESVTKRAGPLPNEDFFFNRARHDARAKIVLGYHFAPNGGVEEGTTLIHLLANHPSTALFISRKLAIRFVSDQPPQSLVLKMAKTFQEKEGSIAEILMTMVSAPEFWNTEALRQKTKSPFELAISAVRATNAEVKAPLPLYQWITKMGQKLYQYSAPTGYPDRAAYWINTGALLARMNFGLALGANRVPGVRVDLLALNDGHEPESPVAALEAYGRRLLPERDLTATIERLTPMLADPQLPAKVGAAAEGQQGDTLPPDEEILLKAPDTRGNNNRRRSMGNTTRADLSSNGPQGLLAQVVGIIIGSPEFQRR